MTRLILALVLTLLLAGCAVRRAPQKFYHVTYCDKMNADGIHCDRWATPCGRLKCQ